MKVGALVFDFDGTIADTEQAHFEGIRRVLQDEGLPLDWDLYHSRYIGFDDRGAFAARYADEGMSLSPEHLARLIDKKARLFPELVAGQGLEPYPGVSDLMAEASGRGIPVALCTGALMSDVEPLLKMFGLWERLQVRITAGETPRGKPDPLPYRMAVERLAALAPGLKAADCIAFEDTPAGIRSANAAGLRTVAVTNTHARELLAEAWLVVPTLKGVGIFG